MVTVLLEACLWAGNLAAWPRIPLHLFILPLSPMNVLIVFVILNKPFLMQLGIMSISCQTSFYCSYDSLITTSWNQITQLWYWDNCNWVTVGWLEFLCCMQMYSLSVWSGFVHHTISLCLVHAVWWFYGYCLQLKIDIYFLIYVAMCRWVMLFN